MMNGVSSIGGCGLGLADLTTGRNWSLPPDYYVPYFVLLCTSVVLILWAFLDDNSKEFVKRMPITEGRKASAWDHVQPASPSRGVPPYVQYPIRTSTYTVRESGATLTAVRFAISLSSSLLFRHSNFPFFQH